MQSSTCSLHVLECERRLLPRRTPIRQTSRTQQSEPNDGLEGTSAHRGPLVVEKLREKLGWTGMRTKSGKPWKARSASGNGEFGAATIPSDDDDDDERLNLSASLRDVNPRPLIQLAHLAPQLRKPKHDPGENLEAPAFRQTSPCANHKRQHPPRCLRKRKGKSRYSSSTLRYLNHDAGRALWSQLTFHHLQNSASRFRIELRRTVPGD